MTAAQAIDTIFIHFVYCLTNYVSLIVAIAVSNAIDAAAIASDKHNILRFSVHCFVSIACMGILWLLLLLSFFSTKKKFFCSLKMCQIPCVCVFALKSQCALFQPLPNHLCAPFTHIHTLKLYIVDLHATEHYGCE